MKSIYKIDHLEKKATTKGLSQQTMWNMNIALAFYIFTVNENTSKIQKYKFENNKKKFNT
jgi:hypothetical protein